MPSDEYFAGYFDGEGSISFSFRTNSTMPRLNVSIGTCHAPTLQLYASRFGGQVTSCKSFVNKPKFRWQLGSVRDCFDFLKAIQPHCVEKRQQVDLAIDWLEYRMRSPLFGTHTPVDTDKATATHARFQRLKREASELSLPLSAPVLG